MVDSSHPYKLFIANRYTTNDTYFLMGTGGRTIVLALGRKNRINSKTKFSNAKIFIY